MTELTKKKLNDFLSDKNIADYRIGRIPHTNNDFIVLDNGVATEDENYVNEVINYIKTEYGITENHLDKSGTLCVYKHR